MTHLRLWHHSYDPQSHPWACTPSSAFGLVLERCQPTTYPLHGQLNVFPNLGHYLHQVVHCAGMETAVLLSLMKTLYAKVGRLDGAKKIHANRSLKLLSGLWRSASVSCEREQACCH